MDMGAPGEVQTPNCNFGFSRGHCAVVSGPILVQHGLFSPILTVFDLLRALEGRYGPRFVLGRDILVVYGVCLLSSTCNG